MSPTSYLAAPSRVNYKEDVGFEPTHAFTRLTVFKTVPFSRTWVILQIYSPYGIRTRVTAVKRRCLNPLTNGPSLCRLHDLNTRPSDYKSDALPTELSRLIIILLCGLRDLNPHAVKRQILNLVRLPIPPNPQNMTRTGLEPVTH